jgi:hypothetical protein
VKKLPVLLPFFIACVAAILVVIQTTRVTPLIDYTHNVEVAYRIYRGEIPYRDFFLTLPPGTFLVMAALMLITHGYSHGAAVIFTAIVAGISVLLLNGVLKKLQVTPMVRVFLLSILPFTGHGIYPWPNYDVYSGIMLGALFYLLLRIVEKQKITPKYSILFGFLGSGLFLFKQNIGIAYAAGVMIIFLLAYTRFPGRRTLMLLLSVLAGTLCFFFSGFLVLLISGSTHQFFYQTFEYVNAGRQPVLALTVVAGQYAEYFSVLFSRLPFILLFLLPVIVLKKRLGRFQWLFPAGLFIYLAVSSIRSLSAIQLPKDQYSMILLVSWVSVYCTYILLLPYILTRSATIGTLLIRLFPVVCIMSANATYLTHHIVGSSYGLWPVFIIVAGISISVLHEWLPQIHMTPIVGLCCCFLFYGLFMNYQSRQFFDYVSLTGPVYQSQSPRLYGAGTPGIWMSEFDQLVTYVATNIPANDRVASVPGEDPFYAATGRNNPLPILMLKVNIYPFEGMDIPKYFAEKDIRWIIAKRETQLNQVFGYIDITNPRYEVQRYYTEYATVGIFTLYKRNSSPL